MTAKKRQLHLLLLPLLLSTGCRAPFFDPEEVPLTSLAAERRASEVLVGGFYDLKRFFQRSDYQTFGNVRTYKLTVSDDVEDKSAEMAQLISQAGLPAKAVKLTTESKLRPGQVAVFGSIDARGKWDYLRGSDWAQVVVSCITILIYGGVIPYPFPIHCGYEVKVNVVAVDHQGKELLKAEPVVSVYTKSHYFTTEFWTMTRPEARDALRPGIARAIVKALGKAR